ncbi:uncharacterized protein PRCAT00002799001 [Priceomyces carsonii]|uniref:uncharacterized protein n=1 Tax=Priceomyces carsonii TaxID=28549 RepID=UPI002ED999DD|nr:unnamed protein product [Priceomyces carsonii]
MSDIPGSSTYDRDDSVLAPNSTNKGNGQQKISHSPSSSISSVNSDSSTGKLIESLSIHKLSKHLDNKPDDKSVDNKNADKVEKLEKLELPKEQGNSKSPDNLKENKTQQTSDNHKIRLPKNEKHKAIKFTVRKVSHEPINSPPLGKNAIVSPANAGSQDVEVKSQNIEHLISSQTRYDHYTKKIAKIDKEIDFLTNLLPPYNVEIDYPTRTKITAAIRKLRMKQDELENKKYKLGINISRLWREQDENNIWVRSVSNS